MGDMSRPRRSASIRADLIAEGIAQLSEHGYHGTGIKQILDQVRVPKGSFYNYFPSKEAYVAEIIAAYSADGLRQLDEYLAGSRESPLEKIRVIHGFILRQFAAQEVQRGCLIGSLAAEMGGSSRLCQEALQAACAAWRERLAMLFEAARAAGEVRQDLSADAMASLFWAAWEGSLLRMRIEGTTAPVANMIDLLLEQVLRKR